MEAHGSICHTWEAEAEEPGVEANINYTMSSRSTWAIASSSPA